MSRGPIRNATGDTFFAWDGDVLVVNILGKPGVGKDAIGKPKGTQLKVGVTATPVAGKATDHMVRFLAPCSAWRRPTSKWCSGAKTSTSSCVSGHRKSCRRYFCPCRR